jgi:ABC-type sulfate transport system permease subunit
MRNLLRWLGEFRAAMVSQYGAATGNVIVTLFVALVLIYVGFMFIAQFTPIIGNITYEGGGIIQTFFDLGKWLIPVLAIVGLIIYGVTHFLGGGGGGGGRRRGRR